MDLLPASRGTDGLTVVADGESRSRYLALAGLLVALVAAALLGLPAEASAQRGGVIVDPDTPAGKEYAIPLESARREAGGGGVGNRSGGGSRGTVAGAFGVGLSRASGDGSEGGRSQDQSGRQDGDGSRESGDGAGAGAGASAGARDGSDGAPDVPAAEEVSEGSFAAGSVVGIILALLAIGGLLGLLLRRRGSPGAE